MPPPPPSDGLHHQHPQHQQPGQYQQMQLSAALIKAMQTPVPRLKSLAKLHIIQFDKDLDDYNREFSNIDPRMTRKAASCMSPDDVDIVAAHLFGSEGPSFSASEQYLALADQDQRGGLFSLYHVTTPPALSSWLKDLPKMHSPFDIQAFHSYTRSFNFAVRFLGPEFAEVAAKAVKNAYVDGLRPSTFSTFVQSLKLGQLSHVQALAARTLPQFLGDSALETTATATQPSRVTPLVNALPNPRPTLAAGAPVTNRYGNGPPLTEKERADRLAKVQCRKCSKFGHYADKCTSPPVLPPPYPKKVGVQQIDIDPTSPGEGDGVSDDIRYDEDGEDAGDVADEAAF